ncbi:MAG TPA: hypothetical protein VFW22_01980 [Pseudolabrys sp.]|nr:hypothetical protein [Pseudolabrys sp.]
MPDMHHTEFRARADRIAHRMLDIVGLMLDRMESRNAPMPDVPLTPEAAAPWRWVNDRLGFWRHCRKPLCHRPRRCRGEPRACLNRHLPQVPDAARKRALADFRAARALQTLDGFPAPRTAAAMLKTGHDRHGPEERYGGDQGDRRRGL